MLSHLPTKLNVVGINADHRTFSNVRAADNYMRNVFFAKDRVDIQVPGD